MTDEVALKVAATMMGAMEAPEPIAMNATKTTEDDGLVHEPFSFDDDFQAKILTLIWRDGQFNDRTMGLIRPEYFQQAAHATLAKIGLNFFRKYRSIPSLSSVNTLLKDAILAKQIRPDIKAEVIALVRQIYEGGQNMADRDYVIDKVAEFARTQAITHAILKSAELLQNTANDERFAQIDAEIKRAQRVGASEGNVYDYFGELQNRVEVREELLKGTHRPTGITTGVKFLDDRLYHKGWGRHELSVYMAGAKVGKSIALLESAIQAARHGYSVLHVTLEMSVDIAVMRMDANLSEMTVQEVRDVPSAVGAKIQSYIDASEGSRGKLLIAEFPSGTLKPSMLRQLINYHKANGTIFDLVTIDYLDIMSPDYRTDSDIANSKSIWVDCRAIAQEEGFAMLTATQTNREGFSASVAKAEHAADDFNKIRIADLVISINKTEDEARAGEARLYFAASRNQQGGFTIKVKQDTERMKFIAGILSAF